MAGSYLAYLLDYNAWANATLIEFLEARPELFAATAPGVYGTVGETLNHLLDAELSYVARLAGTPRPDRGSGLDLPALEELAAQLAAASTELLAALPDPDRLSQRSYGKVTAATVLAQLVSHGVEHRTQVCTILGALGIEPPDLSSWRFGGSVP